MYVYSQFTTCVSICLQTSHGLFELNRAGLWVCDNVGYREGAQP